MTSTKNKGKGACIACGKCLSFCPVLLATLQEEFSPKAKNQLFEALENSDTQLDERLVKKLAEMCVSCGRCTNACPQGLSVPNKLAVLRKKHPGWEQYLWDLWISKGDLFWPALGTIGKALGECQGKGRLSSIRAMAPFPEISPWVKVLNYDKSGQGKKALFFAGCTANRVRREWVKKATTLLENLGYTHSEEKMECCGGTLLSAGLEKSGLKSMHINIETWRKAGRPLLVTACTSCIYSLAKYTEHEDLFKDTDEREQWDYSVCSLASLWGKTTFDVSLKPSSLRWHSPCHGIHFTEDYTWLNIITDGALVSPQEPICCGLGGVVQLANHKLSTTISSKCWDVLSADKGTQVVTGCSGCIIQLTTTRPPGVEVVHWLDIIELR